jgi:hypothetical protein
MGHILGYVCRVKICREAVIFTGMLYYQWELYVCRSNLLLRIRIHFGLTGLY